MSNEADFFVAGGTLRTSAPSYVTRPADAELLQHLQAGEFCYVLTPRQMGKSSLMVRTAQRLRAEGVRVAIIDLTSIGASSSAISAEQWYLGLLSRMRSDLRLATDAQTWWQAHSAFSVSQRFTDFLQQVVLTECADKVVILIDEIDSTLNLPFHDDFFAAMRAVYNERAHNPIYSRLTFALFGVATPTDLIQDRERTPFNIGQRIDLREFTLADAKPLQQGLASQWPEQADAIFQRIFYWTNGHPYLTQKLCQSIVLHTIEWQEAHTDQAVDQLVNTAFLSEEGRKDPNLTFVQDRILNSPEREQRQMLRLYRQVRSGERITDDDRSLIQNRLELYGLVGVAQGMLQVRSRIYEQVFTPVWVDSVMPTNHRQRNAWLAATIALLLVVGMSAFLLLQPDSTCSELQAQFEENATNSIIRISTLAGLIESEDTCGSMALDLFYSLEPQEQIALFVGLDNPFNERTELEAVVDKIYRTLDTVPEHDLKLMEIWLNVLKNAGANESDPLINSINNWKKGREHYTKGEYAMAEELLNLAIVEEHPVLYYDHALSLIKQENYEGALSDLNTLMELAMRVIPTPTPEATIEASPSVEKVSVTPVLLTAPVSSSLATTATLLQMPTNNIQGSLLPYSARDYRRRFNNLSNITSFVEQTLEKNPSLFNSLQSKAISYPNLLTFANPSIDENLSIGNIPPGCVNLIEGGDFEQFDSGWQILTSTRPPIYSSEQTFNNSLQAMRLGNGLEALNVESVSEVRYKPILLPNGATRIILRFLYYPLYEAAPGADLQQADLVDATTEQLLGSLLNSQEDSRTWNARDFDLTLFAGRSVSLRFRVRNDGISGRTLMYLDNVEIEYCAPIPLPISTQIVILPWKSPTPISTPTSSSLVLATITRQPLLTLTPFVPTATSAQPIDSSVILLAPLDSALLRGRQIFSWSTNITLAENQYFELIFWPVGDDPFTSGFGPTGASKATEVILDLDKTADMLPNLFRSGKDYQWGVLLVELKPYRRLQYLGGGHYFRFVRSTPMPSAPITPEPVSPQFEPPL